MTTDETELRGLRNLIEQTIQRAKAYTPRITDPDYRTEAQRTVEGLVDLSINLELTIEKLGKR